MRTVVMLEKEGAFVTIKPMGFLGDELFKSFRKAVEGALYDRKTRKNKATLDKVPGILNRLREAEFPVRCSDELTEALAKHTMQLWHDVQAAKERAAAFDAQMGERINPNTGKPYSLYPFQATGITWLAMKHGALLADEMGLGKTVQALGAIPAQAGVVVVCPNSLKTNWRKEVRQFRPHLRVSLLSGLNSFRWPEPGEMVVLNYDILPEVHTAECLAKRKQKSPTVKNKHLAPGWNPHDPAMGCRRGDKACKGCYPTMPGQHTKECLAAQGNIFVPALAALAQQCPGCLTPREEVRDCMGCMPFLKLAPDNCVLVFDEAHKLTNPESQRSVRSRGLSWSVRGKNSGRSWLLTATPLVNYPNELWSVLSVAQVAQEVFGDRKTFMRLFKGKEGQFGGMSFDGDPEDIETDEIAERLQRVMLRRMKRDVLGELPKKTYRNIEVEVDAKALKAVDDVLDELGGYDKIVKQLDKGLSFETMSKVYTALASAKVPTMLEIVEDFEEQEEPLVVFSCHRAPIDVLAKRPGWGAVHGDIPVEKRQAIVDMFQAGELKGIALTVQAGGEGITLTRACNLLDVDSPWSPSLRKQAHDRVDRIGQTRPVTIHKLVSNHPLDKRLDELVTRKQMIIDASVDAAADVKLDEKEAANG